MPRIPSNLITWLKREVSIEALVLAAGIELKRVGENLVGRCNRHDDKTPSLVVTPEKNLWHCMGACQKGGSVIDWVMWQRDLGFNEAVRLLLEEHAPEKARKLTEPKPPRKREKAELPCPLSDDTEGAVLARDVIDYYHAKGKVCREFAEYLEKRGLNDAELVETFKLGYADRTLGMTLTKTAREKLKETGFFREETGHEHFNGSLVIPVLGENGEVLECYGRKVRSDLRPGTPDHLYLPGPHRGVFNVPAFTASSEIILCESLIDALSFWRHGFRNVTATYGVEGFTEELLEAFAGHGIERVFIAFDRDEAGDRGAEKVAKKLAAAGIACNRVQFPKGMDANEVSLKMHPAKKTFELFLRNAEWMCGGNTDPPRPRNGEPVTVPHLTDTKALLPLAATAPPLPEPNSTSSLAADGGSVSEKPAESSWAQGPKPRAAAKREKDADEDPGGKARPAAKEESRSEAAKEESSALTRREKAAPEVVSPSRANGLVSLGEDEAEFLFEDRRYRVRGLGKCHGYGSLKVNLKALCEGIAFEPPSPIPGWHMDNLDLCTHRPRQMFERQASQELGLKEEILHFDIGRIVTTLEAVQDQRIAEARKPKVKTVALSEKETEEAIAFWKSADLFTRIADDYTRCGLVGELTNKIATYIGATSRLLERPLAIIIQSSSAAGKSTLMEKTLFFMPEEMREKYTAVSGKSLFYLDENTVLSHKILAIVEEEGAEKATYPLKILNSEGELVMASTGKDPATGKLVTKIYRVQGPVMILLTTTSVEIDPELENRCLRLSVDESREQTRRIHELQRMAMTYEGHVMDAERESIQKLHQNAQRLLRRIRVHNPYAKHLTFVDDQTRMRRDHAKYLVLMETIALMHQYQRPIYQRELRGKSEDYVDVTLYDVDVAGKLVNEMLGGTLKDVLPQTQQFLFALDEMVTKLCAGNGVERRDLRFTRRQIRELTGWHDTQIRIHMARLIDLEYVLVHRGTRGSQFVYELVYNGEGKDGKPFVLGLVDVARLMREETVALGTTSTSRGLEGEFAGSSRGHHGPVAVRLRGEEKGNQPALEAASVDSAPRKAKNAQLPAARKGRPYTGVVLRFNLLRFPPAAGKDVPLSDAMSRN